MDGLIACNGTLNVLRRGTIGALSMSGELAAMPWGEWGALTFPALGDPELRVPFEERVVALADAGFRGFGINVRAFDLEPAAISRQQALLQSRGVELACVEALSGWCTADREALRAGLAAEQKAIEIAVAFGASRLLAFAGPEGEQASLETMAGWFGALCDRARQHGLKVGLEAVAGTRVRTPAIAWEIVSASGRENGGIVVDAFSFFRSGAGFDSLRSIPVGRIHAVQLSDGPIEPVMPPYEELLRRRQRPGEGAFDLGGLIRTMDGMGFDGDWEVEIFSDYVRSLPLEQAVREAYETTVAVMALARG